MNVINREKTSRRAATKAPKMVDLDSDLEEGNSEDSSDDFVVSDSDDDFDMGKSKAAAKKKAT